MAYNATLTYIALCQPPGNVIYPLILTHSFWSLLSLLCLRLSQCQQSPESLYINLRLITEL